MVTAVDLDTDIIETPCEGYLKKPVSRQEVLEAVEQAFLIEAYEGLVFEYYGKRKKWAALAAECSREEIDSERFVQLEARISEIETEMSETVDRFPDSELSEAFRGLRKQRTV